VSSANQPVLLVTVDIFEHIPLAETLVVHAFAVEIISRRDQCHVGKRYEKSPEDRLATRKDDRRHNSGPQLGTTTRAGICVTWTGRMEPD